MPTLLYFFFFKVVVIGFDQDHYIFQEEATDVFMSVEVQQGELDTNVRVLVTSSSGTAQGTYNSLTSMKGWGGGGM